MCSSDLPAESGIAISLFSPETEKAIDPINPACPVAPEDGTGMNPVQYKNLNLAKSTNSYEEQDNERSHFKTSPRGF